MNDVNLYIDTTPGLVSYDMGSMDNPFVDLSKLGPIVAGLGSFDRLSMNFSRYNTEIGVTTPVNIKDNLETISVKPTRIGSVAGFNFHDEYPVLIIDDGDYSPESVVINFFNSFFKTVIDSNNYSLVELGKKLPGTRVVVNFHNCMFYAEPGHTSTIQPVKGVDTEGVVEVNYRGCTFSADNNDRIIFKPSDSAIEHGEYTVTITDSLVNDITEINPDGEFDLSVEFSEFVTGIDFSAPVLDNTILSWFYKDYQVDEDIVSPTPVPGICGTPRKSPGAFYFIGQRYYVNLGQAFPGIGTRFNPMSYNQMLGVFNGTEQKKFAAEFLIRGSFNPSLIDNEINSFIPKNSKLDYVVFRSWDLSTKGLWGIHLKDYAHDEFYMTHPESSSLKNVKFMDFKIIDETKNENLRLVV